MTVKKRMVTMDTLKLYFASLTPRGRAAVGLVLLLAVAGLLALAMRVGLDLSWIPNLLSGA